MKTVCAGAGLGFACDDQRFRLWVDDGRHLGVFCLAHSELLLAEHQSSLLARPLSHLHNGTTVSQHCYVRIRPAREGTDFDPDWLTARLGLAHTRAYRRGERGFGLPRRTAWFLDGPWRLGFDFEDLVEGVVAAVEPAAQALREARSDVELDVEVVVVQYVHGYVWGPDEDSPAIFSASSPAVGLNSQLLRRIAALAASIDVDQYINDLTSCIQHFPDDSLWPE